MKNFKSVLIVVLSFVMLAFMSCKDNAVAPQSASFSKVEGASILVSSLPQAVKDFVASKYNGISIVSSTKYPQGYEVKLSDNTILDFGLKGEFLEVFSKSNPNDSTLISLPAAIVNYISKNYPTQTILKAEKGDKKIEVTLSNAVKLEFNLDGTFREALSNVKNITASELPKKITEYLAANYASLKIVKVEICNKKIEVKLSDGVKLEFNLDSSFKEVSGKMCGGKTDLAASSLPLAINTYIKATYPTLTISKAEKGVDKYEVTLSNGLKLEFNLDGSFKEDSGKKKG